MPRSGNFADVYEFDCPATKSKWAVKCFTRQVAGLHERYAEISRAPAGAATCRSPSTSSTSSRASASAASGIPVLKMRWVEGLLLNEFVRDNLDKPPLLAQLGVIWVRMAKRLREAGIAHCRFAARQRLLVPGSKANARWPSS